MPFFPFYSDELTAFEESWRNARDNLPGWDPEMNMLGNSTAPLPPFLSGTFTHNHFFFLSHHREEKDIIEAGNFFMKLMV